MPGSGPAEARTAAPRPLGFTLVELLVVIAVVVLLLGMMLPSIRRVREEARRTVCVAQLKGIGVAMFSYSADNLDFAPPVMEPMGTTAPRTLLSRGGKPVNLGTLWPREIQEPAVYLCPSQRKFNFRNRMDELARLTIGGSYAYAVNKPARQSPRFGAVRHLALISDDFVARNGDFGLGRYSHRTGYNVLYTDGSALWWPDADESVWKRAVHWDDERDDVNYQTLYDPDVSIDPDQYGDALDIFRVWHAFCYSQPDVYPNANETGSEAADDQ